MQKGQRILFSCHKDKKSGDSVAGAAAFYVK
jgi:hypothetical protein